MKLLTYTKLDDPTPSLHSHYGSFDTTTSRSVTGHCVGFQPHGITTCAFPLDATTRLHWRSLLKLSASGISAQLLTFRKGLLWKFQAFEYIFCHIF